MQICRAESHHPLNVTHISLGFKETGLCIDLKYVFLLLRAIVWLFFLLLSVHAHDYIITLLCCLVLQKPSQISWAQVLLWNINLENIHIKSIELKAAWINKLQRNGFIDEVIRQLASFSFLHNVFPLWKWEERTARQGSSSYTDRPQVYCNTEIELQSGRSYFGFWRLKSHSFFP